MGRRAKNKQSAPEPLHSKASTTKKLGKRKADADLIAHPRPTKKLKKVKTESATPTRKENAINADHAVSSGDSGDGWEDVEDDPQAK